MTLNVELLQRSFNGVKDRGEEFSAQFYATLFTDYPGVKPLFANTHLEEQGKKLFASLAIVINHLQKPEVLDTTLKGLGTRHIQYGVLPQHYPMVGNTLLKTLAGLLATNWSPEMEQAWNEAYGIVTQLMLTRTDNSPDILKLTDATVEEDVKMEHQ
jgi:hemoglobin-like flavoprotein